jgi:4-cresol dehydrogenase (hydroxylating)
MARPSGVTPRDFDRALQQFEAAVGAEWVFTSDADVALYRDAYSPFKGEPEERVASAAVAPHTVEEVQAVVRAANTYRIPLYTISTGKNLGYGGSAPNLSGSVVLDLKRMNRILEVNERNASALVEPGVSYFDFYRYIQEHKLKVWMDCPDPGWGSLIGNALDHGGGYTQTTFRNHFDAHCGMEVVLANGDLLRTGMGALPNSQTWQQYKFGIGPWIDGLFSQSNFGVVTKMGFWLMPEPEAYLTGTVSVPKHEDLVPLVDILNLLENGGVVNGMPQLGSPLLGGFFEPIGTELADLLGRGAATQELEEYARRHGTGYWSCTLKFYGPAKAIAANWEYAQEKFSVIPGATFENGETFRFPLSSAEIDDITSNQAAGSRGSTLPEFGIPSLTMFSIGARTQSNPNPTDGHMWFSPIIPRTGEAIFEANRVFAQAAKDLDLPIGPVGFNLPSTYWNRAFIYLFGFPVTRDIETNKRNRAKFERLVQIAAEHGWGEYRTPPAYQEAVLNTYSFNDHALRRFHETLKDAVDPTEYCPRADTGSGRNTCAKGRRTTREHSLAPGGGCGRRRARLRRGTRRGARARRRQSRVRQVVRTLPRRRSRQAGNGRARSAI